MAKTTKLNISVIDLASIDAKKLVDCVQALNDISVESGIDNIFQPGLIKEILIAKVLNHNVVTNKRMPDACSKSKTPVYYEYLSCYEGGSGQLDRMFKHPADKRAESLRRITRNDKVYFAIFKRKTLDIKVIYEIEIPVFLKETERQLDGSSNNISHVGFNENWAKANGKVAYPKIVKKTK